MNDVQTLVVAGSPGGTFTLTLGDTITDDLAFGCDPSVIEAALAPCKVRKVSASGYIITSFRRDGQQKHFTIYPRNDVFKPLMTTHKYLSEYTVGMDDVIEDGLVCYRPVFDTQIVLTTGDAGFFTLVLKHHPDGLGQHRMESTASLPRNVNADVLARELNSLPRVYEHYDITVEYSTTEAYRIEFPTTTVPLIEVTPTFEGGTSPIATVLHTVVGRANKTYNFTVGIPPEQKAAKKIVVQRNTR